MWDSKVDLFFGILAHKLTFVYCSALKYAQTMVRNLSIIFVFIGKSYPPKIRVNKTKTHKNLRVLILTELRRKNNDNGHQKLINFINIRDLFSDCFFIKKGIRLIRSSSPLSFTVGEHTNRFVQRSSLKISPKCPHT